MFILLRGVFTYLVLTNTCFGLCIGHHHVVHILIIKQTAQYYNVLVFVNEISFKSVKFAFKIITVAVELNVF